MVLRDLRHLSAGRRTLARCLRALVVACLLWTTSLGAEPFAANDTSWEGTSELLAVARAALGAQRVELVGTLDWEALTLADGLLVLHPESALNYDEASAFMRAGGRLALLDDYGKGDALLQHFQIRRVSAPLRPARMLRDNPRYAIAVPSTSPSAGLDQGRHPMVAGVRELVTNHPMALMHPNLTPVLEIPALGEPSATLALTGVIATRGRLLVMADPSAVINLMLRYPGNREFAGGLVEYLVEDDTWGARGGKLYIAAGSFRQRGSFGGRDSLTEQLREQLAGASELLDNLHDDGLPGTLALLFAVVAAGAGLFWLGQKTLRTYRRLLPRYASALPMVAQGGVAGRAAVLAAPGTHRALPLLELQAALLEGLCHQLGLAQGAPQSEVLAEIDRQDALSRPSSGLLRSLLEEMKRAELAVTASQPLRLSNERLERIRADVVRLLDEVGSSRQGRSP